MQDTDWKFILRSISYCISTLHRSKKNFLLKNMYLYCRIAREKSLKNDVIGSRYFLITEFCEVLCCTLKITVGETWRIIRASTTFRSCRRTFVYGLSDLETEEYRLMMSPVISNDTWAIFWMGERITDLRKESWSRIWQWMLQ